MKKLCISIAAVLFFLAVHAEPNQKVLSSFSQSFPQADSISWYENASNYEVHFVMGSIRCRLWYDNDGMVTKAIRYYSEQMLPPMIRCALSRRFDGKTVFGVTEISGNDGLQYSIVLQDDQKWYEVSSDAMGNLVLNRKFNKG